MPKFRLLSAALAASVVAFAPVAAEPAIPARPPPLSAYGRLPEIEDGALSPDGKHLAVLTRVHDQRVIGIFSPELKLERLYPIGDEVKVRSLAWAGNDNLLVQTSQTRKLYGFSVDKFEFTATAIVPTDKERGIQAVFGNRSNLVNATFGSYGVRQVDGHWYAYFGAIMLKSDGGEYVFDHGRPYLYRVDVATNRPEKIDLAPGEGTSRDWIVGRDGTVAATLDVNQTTGAWTIRAGGKTIASGKEPQGDVSLLSLGKASDSVIYGTPDAEGDFSWYEVPLAGGTPKPFLADADIGRFYFDPLGGNLVGYLEDGEPPHPVMFDPALQSAARKIRQAFGKYDMTMVDFTPDMTAAIVKISGNADSGSWFIVDVPHLKAGPIAYERTAIGPEQVGPISTVAYKAKDGMDLDGILTLPPGREARNLPVVMLPHGGPSAYDRAQFDWWAQAFASRGYAVFQPNFRGSTNRDSAFRLAGNGEWGGKMQTDVSDRLAALAAKGIVDPKRACIVGASYGGYAALAGVTMQHGIYRCAVAVAGVSDLKAMYEEDFRESGERRTTRLSLLEQLGPKDRWNELSPIRHAAEADAPILLIHGKDDTVVPYSHSTRMADALKDAHKPYEMVTLPGEDHWLSRATTRLQMLEAAVAFVEKHNPAH